MIKQLKEHDLFSHHKKTIVLKNEHFSLYGLQLFSRM